MGLFDFLKPTPSQLLIKALPLYLEETERPILQQRVKCILGSELSKGDALCRQIVSIRSITTGCFKSAFHIAKKLTNSRFSMTEDEFSKLSTSLEDLTIDSIIPEYSSIIRKSPDQYRGIVREVSAQCVELTYTHVISDDNADAWREGISALYKESLIFGSNPEKVAHSVARDYSFSVAEQHGKFVLLLVEELEGLMKIKAR
jgi:hypothetical protein